MRMVWSIIRVVRSNWEVCVLALTAAFVLSAVCRTVYVAYGPMPSVRTLEESKDLVEALRCVRRRNIPLDIASTGTFRDLLRDEDVAGVLPLAEPCWTGPNIGLMLHSIRLWGRKAVFSHSWATTAFPGLIMYSTPDQLRILLDHSAFLEAFKFNFAIPPFLLESEVGVAVTTNKDPGIAADQGQFHPEKLLQVLAEIGCQADERVYPRRTLQGRREFTINDILSESLWSFHDSQELDFTASAYSRWLLGSATWRNRYGEECSLDQIASRLVERPFGEGSCLGTHLPYALVSLLRANDVEPILSKQTAAKVANRLRELSDVLTRRQQANGAWSLNWYGPFHRTSSNWVWYLGTPPYAELLVTGHQLEWIALAPPEVCPPRDTVKRAVEFMTKTMRELREPLFLTPDLYTLGTHAARALCLIRGVNPYDVYQRLQPTMPGMRRVESSRMSKPESH